MKKSEQYRAAQLAVIECSYISSEAKREIVHTLMGDEELEKFREQRDAEKEAAE